MIVNTSWSFGKIAQLDNTLGIWLRNLIMKCLPESVNKKQLETIFKLN